MKRLAVSWIRLVLRPFGWGVAPLPMLRQELNNTAIMRGAVKALAARVKDEVAAHGLYPADQWLDRLEDEILFWFGYFATDGVEYGGPGAIAAIARPHAFQHENLFANRPAGTTLTVLDVGAGPISQLGTVGHSVDVRMTAVDPLAPAYDVILELLRVARPTPTVFGVAEYLSGQFEAGSFDLVHARNALDHGLDPVAAIHEMAGLVRDQGWMVLDHGDREADRQAFKGLHQWNLFVTAGRLHVEGGDRVVRVIDHGRLGFNMRSEAHVEDGKQCLRLFYQRISPPSPRTLRDGS